jgi:predicted TIM-barrel fold metal-dependent hydrolase
VAQGAKGVKFYTGHNDFHDAPLDDPEMLPVYEWCEKNQFPIVWHVNLNNFQEEFTRVMLKFPKLRVMIPHFGVGFFDTKGVILGRLGEILDTYPNVFVDSSFGTREILVSGMERVSMVPGLFRTFYEKYQDRIIWGTDMVVTGNKEKTEDWIASMIRGCRDLHEKADYVFWMGAKGSPNADKNSNNPYGHMRGLALSPEILKKIYETNVEKFLSKS